MCIICDKDNREPAIIEEDVEVKTGDGLINTQVLQLAFFVEENDSCILECSYIDENHQMLAHISQRIAYCPYCGRKFTH